MMQFDSPDVCEILHAFDEQVLLTAAGDHIAAAVCSGLLPQSQVLVLGKQVQMLAVWRAHNNIFVSLKSAWDYFKIWTVS